jgi:hypothetical protein
MAMTANIGTAGFLRIHTIGGKIPAGSWHSFVVVSRIFIGVFMQQYQGEYTPG